MRKVRLFFALVAGLLLVYACSKENDWYMPQRSGSFSGPVFHASVVLPEETRTQLGADDAQEIFWTPGDDITVFDGEGTGFQFLADVEVPSAGARFSGADPKASLVDPDPYFYALYPFDASASIEGPSIRTTYPSAFQISRYGSFMDKMNLAVAFSDDYSLQFRSVAGWIRVGFTGDEGINRIVFYGNNGERLAGTVLVNPETLETSVAEEGSSTKLTFRGNFFSSATKEEGYYYYIPVLALSFEKGFTLRFYKADGTTYTYTYGNAVTFNQGRRRRLWVDLSQLPIQYTYARVTASSPLNDGDEYVLAYPDAEGSYKVFDQDKLMANIEGFKNYSLTDFAMDPDKRYGMVGTRIFNGDYRVVPGDEEEITLDPGIGIVSSNKTAVMQNETASFPKSKEKPTGIKMTVSELGLKNWDSATKTTLGKGALDSEDMYILCDQILSRHSSYYNGNKWSLMIAFGGGSLRNLVANQYNGDYGITAGYVVGSYGDASYEGFAFKDTFLYNPSSYSLKKVLVYRRTPSE